MNDLDFIDVSDYKSDDVEELSLDENNLKKETGEPKKKDRFIIGIYISLAVLIVLTTVIYFFGYELFKPFIKV